MGHGCRCSHRHFGISDARDISPFMGWHCNDVDRKRRPWARSDSGLDPGWYVPILNLPIATCRCPAGNVSCPYLPICGMTGKGRVQTWGGAFIPSPRGFPPNGTSLTTTQTSITRRLATLLIATAKAGISVPTISPSVSVADHFAVETPHKSPASTVFRLAMLTVRRIPDRSRAGLDGIDLSHRRELARFRLNRDAAD